MLDGRSLNGLDLEAVRRQMGTVIQGARVTAGSLLTNIVGSLPIGADEAWKAAELAGVAPDIRAMPMGMATVVPEGGTGFSGGQLQRILLARALVRRPRILLLDEATSQLDNTTQRIVTDNLAELGVTRVVVAHRLTTIRHADHIVVLDKGCVVEQGQHDELVAANGLFARLAHRQTL
jgi:ATP-binding cassette subfamily C protein